MSEFWQASGSLGIDLNGLDISGTVDAAFYRAGSEVPGSVLTLPDIGSSNVIDASTTDDQTETTDATQPVDSTNDTGLAEAVDSTEQTDPAEDTASSEVETTDATETTTADELTGETDAANAETAESTVENEITTAIDTDSDDSTQTVASTTDVTDVTTEASTTAVQKAFRRKQRQTRRQKQQTQLTGILRTRPLMSTPSSLQGTFEIAGGGGDPKDSIFQGEVELAQMKMTRWMAWSLSSGKRPAASALISMVLISMAPLMRPTTRTLLISWIYTNSSRH